MSAFDPLQTLGSPGQVFAPIAADWLPSACSCAPNLEGRKQPYHKAPAEACIGCEASIILNCMVQYSQPSLDISFAALSDAPRRGVLEQLGRADASITSLADRFQMTLTGMKKHVAVLERAG